MNKISPNRFSNLPSIIILCFIMTSIIGYFIGSDHLATEVDIKNIYLAPFENASYILGTDGIGRSVAFGLVNGVKISLSIAILSSILTLFFGLLFAFLAGYIGNHKLRASYPIAIIWLIISILCFFYIWYAPSVFIFILWLIISYLLLKLDKGPLYKTKKISIPIDSIIMKVIELIKSMPGIFIILFILALFSERSILYVIGLITFIKIPSVTRLARSEIIKVKNQEFIHAAEGMGISSIEVFAKHIFPNILTPLKTYFIYSIVTTILIESTLSFLGLGLPLETVSLGSMLSNSREFFSAWWLAIFPGGLIFLLILSLRKLISHKVESSDFLYL